MKFLIAGAGAVGAYMGAKMARAGLDVTLFARGKHLQAIQERGVRVAGADEEFEARPKTTGNLEQGLGWVEKAGAAYRWVPHSYQMNL